MGWAILLTIILAPLVAAGRIPVAKMSGRGLGYTGGTIDKLESIPGFITTLEKKDFIKQVNQINVAVIGQSGNLVPADKKIYALRDVTATVNSIPLIASSIMSKKKPLERIEFYWMLKWVMVLSWRTNSG